MGTSEVETFESISDIESPVLIMSSEAAQASEKLSIARLLDLGRGMAQQAIALPEYQANRRTIERQAYLDNQFIDDATKEIKFLSGVIEKNYKTYDYDTAMRARSQIHAFIRELRQDVKLVKTTKTTRSDLVNRNGSIASSVVINRSKAN